MTGGILSHPMVGIVSWSVLFSLHHSIRARVGT